jgi:hypothetical protein
MAFEVIDGKEGLVVREGQRLGGHHPHHHAADQPRTARGGDGIKFAKSETGGLERLLDQPIDAFEMGARGDLRHHAAKTSVLGQLAIDHIGEDRAHGPVVRRRLDDRDGRFVAARFDSHHAHGCLLASAAQLR